MKRKTLQIVLIVCFNSFTANFAQSTYYITPTPDTLCPGSEEPCHTLSEYIANGSFNNLPKNTTIQFFPGNHTLNTTIILGNLTLLAVLGDSSSFPEMTSRIVCTWPAGFAFTYITELHINALAFVSCGHNNFGSLNITSVEQSHISRCSFESNYAAVNDSVGGAIAAWNSSLRLAGNTFQNNSAYYAGGAISAHGGTLDVIINRFLGNSAHYAPKTFGGAIAALGGTLNITTNTFQNNSAYQGGAVNAHNVILSITNNTFLGNSAKHAGGAIAAFETLNITTNTFQGNSAKSFGGAIAAFETFNITTINTFQGNSAYQGGTVDAEDGILSITNNTFLGNSAKGVGGAIGVLGTLNITTNTFQGNSAYQGGAVEAECVILSITNNTFLGNSAESSGGAISATFGTLKIATNTFQNNSAMQGGAVDTQITALSFTTNTFQNNSADQGGALNTYNSTYSLTSNTFQNNTAQSTGGGIVTKAGNNLTFTTNTFQGNSAAFGGAITAWHCTLCLTSNTFQHNSAQIGGALYARSSAFMLTGNAFCKNFALSSGGALAAYESTLSLTTTPNRSNACSAAESVCVLDHCRVEKVTIDSNTAAHYGGGLYVLNTTVRGNMRLTGNSATEGGAIYAYGGKFLFNDTTTTANNSAIIGGGMLLLGDSKLHLPSDTTLLFINNTANQTGGAIHVKAVNQLEFCVKEIQPVAVYKYQSNCFFQIELSNKQPYAPNDTNELRQFVQSLNISLHFDNNSAKSAGVDLYGGLVDSCSLSSIKKNQDYYTYSYSGVVFDVITSSESTPNITSDPLRFCICSNHCSVHHYSQSVFPGGTVEVPVTALGQRNQTTIAMIRVVDLSNSITLQLSEYSQNVGKGCSTLRYTIYSHAVGTTQEMAIYANGPCSFDHLVTITIDIQQCPPGFQLSHSGSHCILHRRLQQYTHTCVVANGTVLRPHNAEFWVGYSDDKGLILHPHCPFDYCTSEDIYLKVTHSDKQCNYNRGGLLCGRCSDSLSLVLGSSRCLRCSNSYLSLLAAFTLAGIALVLFLLSLRLTVAVGTINGLVFYANVVTMNSAIFFRPGTTNVLTVFIAWLNLDLGIETCFYNGMDAYNKTWLQFVFPIYVLGLVVVMIFGSNYSERMARVLGGNPIAVLATLFLLSYTKLLCTAIAALSYTTLEYPNSQIAVWLYDGNIGYLSHKHIPLFVVALACLLFLSLPYTMLLTAAQWLQAKSEWKVFSWINNRYIFSFLDAYHAPYSIKHRYCIGLMLLLRLVLFLVTAVNFLGDPRINLLAVLAALVFTAPILASTGVYRSWCLSVLELSFLINLAILISATFYIYPDKANQNAVTLTSVSIAFATFIGIVIYHFAQQIKATPIWTKLFPRPEYMRVPLDDEDGGEGEEDPPDRVYVSGCARTHKVVNIYELQREHMRRAAEPQETQEATALRDPWEATEPHEPQNPIESQKPLKATY